MITKIILTVVTSVVSTVAAAVLVERYIKKDKKSTIAGEAPFQHNEDPVLKTYRKLNQPVY